MKALEDMTTNTGITLAKCEDRVILTSLRRWYKGNEILNLENVDYSSIANNYIGFPNCIIRDDRLYATKNIGRGEVLKIKFDR